MSRIDALDEFCFIVRLRGLFWTMNTVCSLQGEVVVPPRRDRV